MVLMHSAMSGAQVVSHIWSFPIDVKILRATITAECTEGVLLGFLLCHSAVRVISGRQVVDAHIERISGGNLRQDTFVI
jgi:hypothetical protein